ncbi:MAG TPA: hypothetical protein VIP29_01815 [Nitrososphaeraceae archaeon]
MKYHKIAATQLNATNFLLANAVEVFKENQDELLGENLITELDELTPVILAQAISVELQALLTLYDKEVSDTKVRKRKSH